MPIRTKYRQCCFKYKSLIQQHELLTEKRVIGANHLGYFYTFINQRIYDRSDVGVLVDTDNTVIVDNRGKANVLMLILLVCGKKAIMLLTDVKT